MKGTGTKGTAAHQTHEFVNGKYVTVSSGFANYNTPYDSIDAYINLIEKPRYATKVAGAKTLNEFAQGIKNGGYATDPSYVGKLMNIVNEFSLDKFNVNKNISFIPSANYGSGSTSGVTDTAFGGLGSNLLQPLVDFFKAAEINFLKVTMYLTLFIIFIWFFYQAISKEPTVQAVQQQTQKAATATRNTVRTVTKAAPAAATKTAAAAKKTGSETKKLIAAAIKYIPK